MPKLFHSASGVSEGLGHQEAKKKKLGYQHNNDYDGDLEYWRKTLRGDTEDVKTIEFDFPPNIATFKFKLNLTTSFAEINDGRSFVIQLTDKQRRFVKHTGQVFGEPQLMFATEAGWNPCTDTSTSWATSAEPRFQEQNAQQVNITKLLFVAQPRLCLSS